jgi:D-3-phosphoglycerate dehydrogenase
VKDLKSCKILVTPTSYGQNEPRLRHELEAQVGEVVYNTTGRPLASTEVRAMLPGCDGYIAGLDAIDRNALETADRLKVIARYGVGIDNLDLEAAREMDIVVTITPGANSVSVAELTIGLILALARRIPEAVSATRRGEWLKLSGLSLEGKTVGLLGIGGIGKQVVRRLCGFDCRILAYDPYPDKIFAQQYKVELLPQDEVLNQADFVSLHLPLLPETRHLVNTTFLQKMKPGAFLINTSRGELIDEAALVYTIKHKQLRGAALDVFSPEPPSADNPLLRLPEVIVTPHYASHTDGATIAMGWIAFHDCLAVLRGEAPKYPISDSL